MTGENRIRPGTGSGVFLCALAVLLFGIAGCEDRLARMEENQFKLQAMVAANARQLATVSSQIHVGNGEIQEGIQTLDQNDQGLAAGIVAVQGEQASLQATVENGNQTISKRMGVLDENQRLLQDGVAQVAAVAQGTASGVTAIAREHATLHQMVQTAREELGDSIAVVTGNQQNIRTDITQLQQADGRIAEQLVAMTADQTAMRQTLDANHRIVAGQVAAVIENQQGLQEGLSDSRERLQTGFDRLDGGMGRVAADLTTIMNEQNALREQAQAGNEALVIQATVMEEDRQAWTAGLQALHQETRRVAADVTTLAAGQSSIHQAIRAGVGGLQEGTDRVGAQLSGLTEQQASLQQRIHMRDEALARRTAELADAQETLAVQLDLLMATASQAALDILGLHDSQTLLQQAVGAGVNDLGARTDRVAAEVAAVTAGQASLGSAIRVDHEAFSARTAAVVDGQQALRTDIAGVRHRAEEIAADQVQMASAQKAFDQTLRNHAATINGHAVALADNQAKLQTSLDTVAATTGQTAVDVIAAAARQDAVVQSQRNSTEAVSSQMTELARSQRNILDNLDIVTATAGQTALDILAVNDRQTRLAQDVQADRQELAARLAGLMEGQQQWMQRLDAAQDNVQTLAASVATIEQRIATLQGSLQESLDGLTALLGDSGRKRVEFETRVNQDIEAMAGAVAQLSQIEALLKEQMQQIQNGTKSQMDDIISAIQRLNQPPAEMKVSSTGTKPESSVVEAAAQ